MLFHFGNWHARHATVTHDRSSFHEAKNYMTNGAYDIRSILRHDFQSIGSHFFTVRRESGFLQRFFYNWYFLDSYSTYREKKYDT
jgi:hypothetical protein